MARYKLVDCWRSWQKNRRAQCAGDQATKENLLTAHYICGPRSDHQTASTHSSRWSGPTELQHICRVARMSVLEQGIKPTSTPFPCSVVAEA